MLNQFSLLPSWGTITTQPLLLLAPFVLANIFLLTSFLTSLRSSLALSKASKTKDGKIAPIAPYAVPILGNLYAFGSNTKKFITKLRHDFPIGVPIRLRIGTRKIYYISGPELLSALFKSSKELTTAQSVTMVLENAFGVPRSCRRIIERDQAGTFATPIKGSPPIDEKDRYFHINHKIFRSGFQGPALKDLASRFLDNLTQELQALNIGKEWVEIPDLHDIVRQVAFKASTTTMCGPHLNKVNPDMATIFWDFDSYIVGLFKGIPRFAIPKAYKARDRYVQAIKKWHVFANDHLDVSDASLEGIPYEEFYGSKIMRDRARDLAGIEGMNEDGLAGQDAGMLWAANANIIPAIAWCIIDTLLRPNLYAQVLTEITSSLTPDSLPDHFKLIFSPLLQSLWSEELRLRGSVAIQRSVTTHHFKLGKWAIPKGAMMLGSSWHEQHNREIWNEGPTLRDPTHHPIDRFWAERFLTYSDDPLSGPRRPNQSTPPSTEPIISQPEAKFTTASVAGSFIPFGGGQKICPGSFFARYEAIGGMSLFLNMFDVELDESVKERGVEMNFDYFAFGVMPPLGKVGARIRRRRI